MKSRVITELPGFDSSSVSNELDILKEGKDVVI